MGSEVEVLRQLVGFKVG